MSPPPFRAEHIGSLLRPKELLDLRGNFVRGEIDRAALTAAEDRAIEDAVRLQERVGLAVATDGEFRRASYHSYFYRQLGDISFEAPAEDASGGRGAQPTASIKSRIAWNGPIHAADFAFLKTRTKALPKITIPGPCALHFRGGDAAVTAQAYRDTDEFWDDIVAAFRSELRSLSEAGCTYVQIDETAFAKFGDAAVQATLRARGDEPDALIDRYIDMTNRVLAGLPGMSIGMHLCRGNRAGQWHAEGSYEAVAEKLFNRLDIDFFFLEYDSPRAGDFAPLRFVPKEKSIVLGLVSTKMNFLEDKSELKRRIEEASRLVPLDRLAVSPQCGFASTEAGNPLPPEMQEAKLRLVVDLAQDVWGTA
ncbi:MAG: 5-methyltetrahydropteroyltriglutamate--homocysteine methyltransferase [Hyphomicrobiales bacterium]|nr:5-methyltetrahydropteroyltriglutamate--homocysteine methyltransferase [Hyphomicrobiales bacterium]